jgi:hypothetical protein
MTVGEEDAFLLGIVVVALVGPPDLDLVESEAVKEMAGQFTARSRQIWPVDAVALDGEPHKELRQDDDDKQRDECDENHSPLRQHQVLRTSTNCDPEELVQLSWLVVTSAQLTLDFVWRISEVSSIDTVLGSTWR